jgi:hypothetical protein
MGRASALRFSREGAAVGVVDIDDVHRGRGRGDQGGTRRLVRGFPAEESFHPMSKSGCPLVPA